MQPHQQRVVDEKSELDKKAKDLVDEKSELDKKAKELSEFIRLSPLFETLPDDEQERMKDQNDIMWRYSGILGARIEAF